MAKVRMVTQIYRWGLRNGDFRFTTVFGVWRGFGLNIPDDSSCDIGRRRRFGYLVFYHNGSLIIGVRDYGGVQKDQGEA